MGCLILAVHHRRVWVETRLPRTIDAKPSNYFLAFPLSHIQSVTYSTTVMSDYHLSARVADVFVGTSHDVAFYYNYTLPSYNLANARVSVAHGDWSANLFVDNLTNKVALMTANNTSFQFNIPQLVRYSTNQPRTVGMQLLP